jgi:eukaryotic-like serine/threonine-protein kinase
MAKIGSGGMANIYLAYAVTGPLVGQPVALKKIRPDFAEDRLFVELFLREAQITSHLDHPNVCRTFDAGLVASEPFLAMEYLHGATLGSLLAKLDAMQQWLRLRAVGPLFRQACAGVHAVHQMGIIHRDISPHNLFVTEAGLLKVLDFGVAKAKMSSVHTLGTINGKVGYMAPEQLYGDEVDARADVFSLGVVLHELVSGQRLFRRENDFLTCKAITEEPIPSVCDIRPSVPREFARVVERALARDRNDRYNTVEDFSNAVGEAIERSDPDVDSQFIGLWVKRRFRVELERIDESLADGPTCVDPRRTGKGPLIIMAAPSAPGPVVIGAEQVTLAAKDGAAARGGDIIMVDEFLRAAVSDGNQGGQLSGKDGDEWLSLEWLIDADGNSSV